MTVATALVDASEASPSVAEQAVGEALARAGIAHASGVLLFMTADFRKIAAHCVRAAGKAASCLQVSGGTVAGVANERRWVFDRPAVAALVLGSPFSVGAAPGEAPRSEGLALALAGTPNFPPDWSAPAAVAATNEIGSLYSDPMFDGPLPVWTNGRIAPESHIRIRIAGTPMRVACSSGVRLLGSAHTVDISSGFDLQRIGGLPAADILRRELPAELHDGRPASQLPLHLINLAVIDPDPYVNCPPRLLPLVSLNGEGSVTVGDRVRPGEIVQWAIRQAVHSENDMRAMAAGLLADGPPPAFGLYASCIGRGPYFYGGEERDWQVLRDLLPHTPFLGIYGSGQMTSVARHPRLMQNSCVLALACTPQET